MIVVAELRSFKLLTVATGRFVFIFRRMKSSTFLYYIGTFLLVALRFLQNVMIARYSGPEEMGIFLGALILPQLLSRVYDLSLGHAFIYEIRLDRNNFAPATATLISHYLLIAPVIFLSSYLFRYYPFDSASIFAFMESNFLYIFVIMSSALITNTLSSMFVADNNYFANSVILLTSPVFFIFYLAAFHGGGVIYSGQLVGRFALSETVGAFFALALSLIRARRCFPCRFRLEGKFYRYGIGAHGGVIAKVAVARLDRAIAATFLTPSALALYSLAASFRDIAQTPATTYTNIFYGKFIKLVKKNGDYMNYFYRISIFWGALILSGCVVFCFFAKDVVHIVYGDRFHGSARLFVILSLGNVGTVLSAFCWAGVMALRRPGISTITIIVGATIGVPLSLAAVYFFQLDGAAWGSVGNSLVLLVSAGVGLWIAHKKHQAPSIQKR